MLLPFYVFPDEHRRQSLEINADIMSSELLTGPCSEDDSTGSPMVLDETDGEMINSDESLHFLTSNGIQAVLNQNKSNPLMLSPNLTSKSHYILSLHCRISICMMPFLWTKNGLLGSS